MEASESDRVIDLQYPHTVTYTRRILTPLRSLDLDELSIVHIQR